MNKGGDADTIGAITGGLAGAIYGAAEIPLHWLDKLDNEPNRRTVGIFCNSPNQTGNAPASQLIGLAQKVCQHYEKL